MGQFKSKKAENLPIVRGQEVEELEFQVLKRMEFSSDRKRMSILIKDPQDGRYKLYMKGADTIVFDRLARE